MTTDKNQWRLASATKACHHDKVQAWDVLEAIQDCPDCAGRGRVPLIPGLRVECDCPTIILVRVEPDWSEKEITPCNPSCNGLHSALCKCQGRRWTVTTNPETVARGLWPLLQDYWGNAPIKLEALVDNYVFGRASGHDAEALEAAARALEEAGLLEKERP